MNNSQLAEDFLLELFKCCLTNKSITEVVIQHLRYQFIPSEPYKLIWKEIYNSYELNQRIPTIGILSEKFKNNGEVIDLLVEIKNINITDKKDEILNEFEVFLKEGMFREMHRETAELFNEGKKEEAYNEGLKRSSEIASFSIKRSYYTKVFADFETRQKERKRKNLDNKKEVKIPFGIHPLDHYTYGGGSLGTSALFLGASGKGKSTLLRWIGMNAARAGYRVVHFQVEGNEQECLDAYDAGWTSIDLVDMEMGVIPKAKETKIKQVNRDIIGGGGEIYVKASEGFDSMYINECWDYLQDIENNFGKVHIAIFDYLEIFNVNGKFVGEGGERKRREAIANKITNISTSFNLLSCVATQANDIKPEKYNNPDFVMTRSDIAEFKGALKPFSYFVTLNQTDDEYSAGIIRLHNEKFRKYKSGQTYKIYQSLSNSRFYDSKKTLDAFWDQNLKKKK